MAACIVKRVRALPLRPWRTHAAQAQVHEAMLDLLAEFLDQRRRVQRLERDLARAEKRA